MRAREYDPTTGRFLSVDPLPPVVGTPCTSSYLYAADDPANRIDPSGRESQGAASCPGAQLAGAVGVFAFGLIDLGLGLTFLVAPEIHATPPVQILDHTALGGTLGLAAHVPTGQVRLHVGHRRTLPSRGGTGGWR